MVQNQCSGPALKIKMLGQRTLEGKIPCTGHQFAAAPLLLRALLNHHVDCAIRSIVVCQFTVHDTQDCWSAPNPQNTTHSNSGHDLRHTSRAILNILGRRQVGIENLPVDSSLGTKIRHFNDFRRSHESGWKQTKSSWKGSESWHEVPEDGHFLGWRLANLACNLEK